MRRQSLTARRGHPSTHRSLALLRAKAFLADL